MNSFSFQEFVDKKRADYILAAGFAPLVSGDTFTDTLSSPVTATTELTTTPELTATTEVTTAPAITDTSAVTATGDVTTTTVVTP